MAPVGRTHLWQTMLAGQWREIGDASLQDDLEAAFSADSDGYRFNARGYTYEIDFDRMKQVNLSTKRERNLRRVPDPRASSVSKATVTTATSAAVPKTVTVVHKTAAVAPKTTTTRTPLAAAVPVAARAPAT